MNLVAYDLADAKLLQQCKIRAAKTKLFAQNEHYSMQYVPTETMVVIGAGNKIEASVNIHLCQQDGIPIVRRPSGGEAVLVSAKTLLFAHIMLGSDLPKSSEFFEQNLQLFIRQLSLLGVKDLSHQGTSDLCIKDKKIMGCAIYRSRNLLMFQSVLNISESPAKIAKYLLMPQRMPEYRSKRAHEDFVTSLAQEGYQIEAADIELAPLVTM